MTEYQVTLFSKTGKYKPVSCIVKSTTAIDLKSVADRKKIIAEGTKKICLKRYWSKRELIEFGYTSAKVREYIKEKN